MSLTQDLWSLTGSTLSPIILVLRLSNSGFKPAMYPSSVVQTGVKSFGWENRIAHPFPIHSWKRIVPSVVSAVKSGASSPMRIAIFDLRSVSALEDRQPTGWSSGWLSVQLDVFGVRIMALSDASQVGCAPCLLAGVSRYDDQSGSW